MNSSQDLISIIIPVYNVEEYLSECIDSVLKQTYKNLEIILVDDGSPDLCPKICDEYAKKDARVKVIHTQNHGLSAARNVGLDNASGYYIMFVDSDDFIDEVMVEKLLFLINKTESDIACCEVKRYKDGCSEQIAEYHLSTDCTIFDRDQILKMFIPRRIDCASWNKLYRSEIIGNRRFIEGRYNEDYIFLFFLYLNCNKIVYTNAAYYNYRIRSGSITYKFNIKSVDKLTNAIEIEQYIVSNGLAYRKEIRFYKLAVCLEMAWAIKKTRTVMEYGEAFEYCKRNISDNFFYIFANGNYSLRQKVKGLLALI